MEEKAESWFKPARTPVTHPTVPKAFIKTRPVSCKPVSGRRPDAATALFSFDGMPAQAAGHLPASPTPKSQDRRTVQMARLGGHRDQSIDQARSVGTRPAVAILEGSAKLPCHVVPGSKSGEQEMVYRLPEPVRSSFRRELRRSRPLPVGTCKPGDKMPGKRAPNETPARIAADAEAYVAACLEQQARRFELVCWLVFFCVLMFCATLRSSSVAHQRVSVGRVEARTAGLQRMNAPDCRTNTRRDTTVGEGLILKAGAQPEEPREYRQWAVPNKEFARQWARTHSMVQSTVLEAQ